MGLGNFVRVFVQGIPGLIVHIFFNAKLKLNFSQSYYSFLPPNVFDVPSISRVPLSLLIGRLVWIRIRDIMMFEAS